MTTIGKDFPVRSDAFRFSSEKRASSAATSPARTECFDIFSAEPGDSYVISQMERLSSKEMKIAARLVWMAVGASGRSATAGMVVSRVGVRNLTLPERRSLSTSPWDLIFSRAKMQIASPVWPDWAGFLLLTLVESKRPCRRSTKPHVLFAIGWRPNTRFLAEFERAVARVAAWVTALLKAKA